jgi:hypothetical protein
MEEEDKVSHLQDDDLGEERDESPVPDPGASGGDAEDDPEAD